KRSAIGAALVLLIAFAGLAGDGFPSRVQATSPRDPFAWPQTLITTRGCLGHFSMPSGAYCASTVSEGEFPRIYVIGDSHSNSLYSGFDVAKIGAVNLGAPGCLPLRNIVRVAYGAEDDTCVDVMDAVYAALGRVPPADVLLVARW